MADTPARQPAQKSKYNLTVCRVGHFAADNAEADPAYAA